MKILPVAFWALVAATAVVSYRWGSMIGLIFFVVMLLTDALLVSRLSPR